MNPVSVSTHVVRMPPARPRRRCGVIGPTLVALLLTGCASGPGRHTRLAADDLDALVQYMVQSLAASEFLRERTADSRPISIVIDKVENLSSDIVTEAEQWMVVARLRGAMPLTEFSRSKNITFQITPERFETLRRAGYADELGLVTPSTHTMAATFRSLRRSGSRSGSRASRDGHGGVTNLRADTYYMEFRITNVQTRALVWIDEFSFTRQARGLVID